VPHFEIVNPEPTLPLNDEPAAGTSATATGIPSSVIAIELFLPLTISNATFWLADNSRAPATEHADGQPEIASYVAIDAL